MEKLELRHLAPYLPYGLKCIVSHSKFGAYHEPKIITTRNITSALMGGWKPLLIPLHQSDNFGLLYSIIKSEISTMPDYLGSLDSLQKFIKGRFHSGFQYLDYRFVEDMFKNHIDVFDLISKGLALNKLDTL